MARKAKKKSRRRSVAQLEKLLVQSEKREKKLRKQLRTAKKRAKKVRVKKAKAARKKARKVPKLKELKSRGRDIRQLPKLGLARDYRSGFKPFLERVDKRVRGKHRAYAIVRVVLLDYADTPTRDLSIFLGSKTAKELKQLTNRQILDLAPGRWGRLGPDSQVLFIATLKGSARLIKKDPIRSKIARTNRRAKAALAAENIRRRQAGLPFNPGR